MLASHHNKVHFNSCFVVVVFFFHQRTPCRSVFSDLLLKMFPRLTTALTAIYHVHLLRILPFCNYNKSVSICIIIIKDTMCFNYVLVLCVGTVLKGLFSNLNIFPQAPAVCNTSVKYNYMKVICLFPSSWSQKLL